jgi:hypothetical protein
VYDVALKFERVIGLSDVFHQGENEDMTIPARNSATVRRFALIAATCTATCIFAAPAYAQDDRTGVSHPADTVITTDSDTPEAAPVKPAKPSAGIPMTKPSQEVYGAYVPYHAPGTPAPAAVTSSDAAFDADANIVTAETAGRADRRLLSDAVNSKDPDAGIVTSVPSRPGELSEGTLIKAKLQETISTMSTVAGTKFAATVSEPLMKDGKVIVPVGSVLEGKVTMVRSGKRISGGAAIHLEPRSITLPDGGVYIVQARVIDTADWDDTKVDEEGTVLRKENAKKNWAVMGLATGGPMAAGAMLGGVPGAVIGAGVGAGVGTIVWLKQDRQAELPKDLGLVFSLTEPMSITPMGVTPVGVASAMPRTAPTGY